MENNQVNDHMISLHISNIIDISIKVWFYLIADGRHGLGNFRNQLPLNKDFQWLLSEFKMFNHLVLLDSNGSVIIFGLSSKLFTSGWVILTWVNQVNSILSCKDSRMVWFPLGHVETILRNVAGKLVTLCQFLFFSITLPQLIRFV